MPQPPAVGDEVSVPDAPSGPGVRDVGVAAAALALSVLLFLPGGAGSDSGPFPVVVSVLLSAVQSAALVLRRQDPQLVVTVVLGVALLHAVALGPVTHWPAWFALYALVRHTVPLRRAVEATAAALVAAVVVFAAGPLLHGVGREQLLLTLALTAVSVLVAALVRTEQARLEALRQRAVSLERERDAAAREAAGDERLRLARDLHDLVGHGLSSMAVQASTVRLLLEAGDVESARTRVSAIEEASRSAMREMRLVLGVLRDEHADQRAPSPGAHDIRARVDQAREAGLDVRLTVEGALDEVPAGVGLAAYRVVQEGLTNAMKHAPGASVDVELQVLDDRVLVEVRDDSRRPRPPVTGDGHGLIGMRERAAALGGELQAGPRDDDHGWRVTAVLPSGSST